MNAAFPTCHVCCLSPAEKVREETSDTDCGSLGSSDKVVHILACNALGVGHYSPMANFIRFLLHRQHVAGVRVVVTFIGVMREWEAKACTALPEHPDLHTERISLSGPDVHPINMNAMITRVSELTAFIDDALEKVYRERQWPQVQLVLHDMFAVYAYRYAEDVLQKPRYLFNPSHVLASGLLANPEFVISVLRGEDNLPLKDFLRPMRLQLMWQMMTANGDEPVFRSINLAEVTFKARGIISNDVGSIFQNLRKHIVQELMQRRREIMEQEDANGGLSPIKRLSLKLRALEQELAVIEEKCQGATCPEAHAIICKMESMLQQSVKEANYPQVFAVSPLCVYQAESHARPDLEGTMRWLDAQSDRSVLFIALGTLYPIEEETLMALTRALEAAAMPFLWTYKARKEGDGEGHGICREFVERTAHFGRVVEWVDQRAVLSHRAIKCFASHCGWNSVVEAMTYAGVPMIAIPLGSEQVVNALIVTDGLGLGEVALREDERKIPASHTAAETEDLVSRIRTQGMKTMGEMPAFQATFWRYPNDAEWEALISEVCFIKYAQYAMRAKEVQVSALKAALPAGAMYQAVRDFVQEIAS